MVEDKKIVLNNETRKKLFNLIIKVIKND